MSEAKFTKGKWAIISDEESIEIAVLESNWHICNMNGRCDNSMNDSCLIAAAPDMYDLLSTIENDDEAIPEWLWDKIQLVLAKARGE